MTEKMLKFVNVDQQTPKKGKATKRLDDFKEIYDDLFMIKLKNNQADVLNAEFHFVKFTALYIIIFPIG